MIRNVASSLRRAAPGQLVRHPLPPQQCPAASSPAARGFHGVAGSGLFRTHAMQPLAVSPAAVSVAARSLNTSAGRSMENNSVEETKSRLVQLLFEEEAAAGAVRRVEKEKLAARAKEQHEKLEFRKMVKLAKESAERKAAKKAKAEELLAQVVRQAESGAATDNEALLLARSARDEQEIGELKDTVNGLRTSSFVHCAFLGAIIGYLMSN